MVIGTILGDASMSWSTTFPRYHAVHSTKQSAYCQSKLDLLKSYCNPSNVKEAKNQGFGNRVVRFATMTTPVFEFIRYLCYRPDTSMPSGFKKTITKELVDQLNWRQVAWWYQDDGCKQSRGMTFGTHAFSKKEVELLADWFRDNGVEAKPKSVSKRDKEYWILHVSTAGAEVLATMIRPFMHPDLLYKLPDSLDKTGACLNCGTPTKKSTNMGPPTQLCSKSCNQEWSRKRGRKRLAKMSPEEKKERSRRNREAIKADPKRYKAWKEYHANRRKKIASDPEKKAKANAYKRKWRKLRKAEGKPLRKLQSHICEYCKEEFLNNDKHKMSSHSPFISCQEPSCMEKRERDYRELRRTRARKKWARDRESK
ncbi:hypothetical protein N9Z02_00805 [Akkermansiaceae bacterium]|nr:hypothetical protein [Akkermansiaceae bacterium]